MGLLKLNEIIYHLSEKERDDFLLYATGPYWKLKEEEKAYLGELIEVGKEKQQAESGQRKQSKPKPMNSLNHKLLRIADAFLVQLEVAAHPLAFQEHLAMAQVQRGCDKNARATLNKFEKMIEAGIDKDQNFHWYEMALWKLKEAINMGKHHPKEGIMNLNQALDSFFIENKLLLTLEMANRKSIISEEDWNSNLPVPWGLIEENLQKQPLGIRLFYHIYQMLTQEQNQPHIDAVESLLYTHHQLMEINFKQTIVVYLKNISVRKINEGQLHFGKKYLEYIQFQEKHDFLLGQQILTPIQFHNIVSAALRVGEVDWGMTFATKYMNKLPEGNREQHAGLAIASIYFHQKKFTLAYRHLQVFHRTQFKQHIISERLRMKILFEQKEYVALNMAVQNFMRFVRTSRKLPEGYKRPLKLFAKTVDQLAKYQDIEPQKILKLKKMVEAEPFIFDKEWLLEKMGQGR